MNQPPAQRRHLAARLKAYRSEAGLTQSQIAKRLEWSASKIIRLEDESVGVAVTDLRALLAEYGITDTETVEELAQVARDSRQLPFAEYRDILSKDDIRYFGYESSAAIIRQVQPLIVPGLLQTEEYTRALLNNRKMTLELVDRIIETRWKRQQILEEPSDAEAFFILDEAVLRRAVGGVETMRRQLERLLQINQLDGVSILVLPFSLGAHAAQRGPYVHLEFTNIHDPAIVYLENSNPHGGGPQFITDPLAVSPYLETFFELEEVATAGDELPRIVAEATRSLTA